MLLDLDGLTLERDGPDGPRRVLEDLRLRLDHGERLALVGGNGSGKSSLLRYLAEPGLLAGIRVGYLCQDPDEQLVATTVGGEVTLGRPQSDPVPILAEVGLAELAGVDPRLLSAGQKQRLQLAVVLAQDPDLLLLDEPSSLQDAQQATWLRRIMAGFRGAVIWATQDRREAEWCGRVLALERGRQVADGDAEAVLDRPPVDALWQPLRRAAEAGGGAVVATLAAAACRFHRGGLAGVNLQVAAGERLGLVGPNGCGKSTLLAMLAGLRPPERGTVTVAGRRLYGPAGRPDLDHGLVSLAPQFPEYLFVAGSVRGEIKLAGADPAATLRTAGLPDAALDQSPHALSGGQRRRLALALSLVPGRPLVLLDEPTAALDAAGRQQVVEQVAALAPASALVMAAHDLEFLRACRCRLLEVTPDGLRSAEA